MNQTIIHFPYKALISSFSGANLKQLDLYQTTDYQTFYPINKSVVSGLENQSVRDPSIHYYHGRFYVVYTWGMAVSDDLIQWQTMGLPAVPNAQVSWAPEFFEDQSGQLYLYACAGPTNTLSIYVTKLDLSNSNNLSWQKLNLAPDYPNAYDPSVAFWQGSYYLAVKNMTNVTVELYKSDSVFGPFSKLSTIPFNRDTEGPALVVADGKIYCYGDGYRDTGTWRMESTNMQNWTNETLIIASDGSRTQHFTVMPVVDDAVANTIQQAVNYYASDNMGSGIARKRLNLPHIQLKTGNNEVYPNNAVEVIYELGGNAQTDAIVNLHKDKITHLTKIYFRNWTNQRIIINANDSFTAPEWQSTITLQNNQILCLMSTGSSDWPNTTNPFMILGSFREDSGWLKCSLASGISGSLAMRLIGDVWYLGGEISWTSKRNNDVVATVPSEFHGHWRYAVAMLRSGTMLRALVNDQRQLIINGVGQIDNDHANISSSIDYLPTYPG